MNWNADSVPAFALGLAPRAELLHVLTLQDFDRVGAIQSYWANPQTWDLGEVVID